MKAIKRQYNKFLKMDIVLKLYGVKVAIFKDWWANYLERFNVKTYDKLKYFYSFVAVFIIAHKYDA